MGELTTSSIAGASHEWRYTARGLLAGATACYDRAASADAEIRALDAEFVRLMQTHREGFEIDYGDLYEFAALDSAGHMLLAFAIENMAKAVIVNRGLSGAPDKLPTEIRTHDLVALAEDAGLGLSSAERDVLEQLARYSTWMGRYPVPTSATELQKASVHRSKLRRNRLLMPDTLRDHGTAVFRRLEQLLLGQWASGGG